MNGQVSASGIAHHIAVGESEHPQVSEVAPVDTDALGVAVFTVVLKSGQRFRVTVEEERS